MVWSEVALSGVEWHGAEQIGVVLNGVEWSGIEYSGIISIVAVGWSGVALH